MKPVRPLVPTLIRSALLAVVFAGGTDQARAHSAAEEMAQAARNLVAALAPEQAAKVAFDLKDEERMNWHFIPRDRKGLSFNDLKPEQWHLAHALLQSGLSHRGYLKAATIMSLEQILLEIEQGKGPKRDPGAYFLSLFGKPEPKSAWGWRVEGHHLSLNFTIAANDDVAATPSFFGSNPAEVRQGNRRGLRVLAAEEDLARRLVQSLSDEQRKAAVIATEAPKDVITGAARKVKPLEPVGLAHTRMNVDQTALLLQIVKEYVYRHRTEIADHDLERIQKAGYDKLLFAWAGGLERGAPHYYRVQGPTFLLEFDNTQNDANHIHAVWRDFDNDFGEDLLRRHYERVPHNP
jgi:hypothetical protein